MRSDDVRPMSDSNDKTGRFRFPSRSGGPDLEDM